MPPKTRPITRRWPQSTPSQRQAGLLILGNPAGVLREDWPAKDQGRPQEHLRPVLSGSRNRAPRGRQLNRGNTLRPEALDEWLQLLQVGVVVELGGLAVLDVALDAQID